MAATGVQESRMGYWLGWAQFQQKLACARARAGGGPGQDFQG